MGLKASLIACLALLVTSACGSSSAGADNNKRPLVLTTFTVVADMAREVAGDRVEVASITKVGSEIHGYEPTPSDLRRASGAALVLENGLGLERWFEQFIDQAGVPHVTLTDGIEPIPIAGDGEYGGAPNPHAWMSPVNATVYVNNIRDALTELDPEGASRYAQRAAAYIAELSELESSLRAHLKGLDPRHRVLVTCEGAFSYLARDFGLKEFFLWPVNAEQEGTPQQIATVIDFVREHDVPAVFCESTVNPKAQQQVARESGAVLAGTLYVDSLSAPDGDVPTYLDLLRWDAEVIVRGLQS